MADISRITLIVLDSVGAGELPDADVFGDKGSHTLGNMAKATGGLNLPKRVLHLFPEKIQKILKFEE